MKARTINKDIKDKMGEWTNTLPEELKEVIQDNIVVTGGSIASMFLQEPVNDYDLYFKDIKSVILVTQHYCKEWIKTNKALPSGVSKGIIPMIKVSFSEDSVEDNPWWIDEVFTLFTHPSSCLRGDKGFMIIHPEDKGIVKLLEDSVICSSVMRVEIFIQSAGVVGENPDDEDKDEYRYFESEEPDRAGDFIDQQIKEEVKPNKRDKGEYKIVFMSSNAITLSDKTQIVIRFFGEPSEIHDTYDFVHATNYWTRQSGLVTNNKALEALLARELIYTGSKYPLASIFRTRKFITRGWSCHVGNYVKMAMQLNEMDLCDPDVIEEQLTSVDAAYLHEIISAIKTKKKDDESFQFNSTYICELADKLMGV